MQQQAGGWGGGSAPGHSERKSAKYFMQYILAVVFFLCVCVCMLIVKVSQICICVKFHVLFVCLFVHLHVRLICRYRYILIHVVRYILVHVGTCGNKRNR